MATPAKTTCEVCHERQATHHICNGETGKSSHLCEECFQSSALPEAIRAAAAVREVHCQYCGGQPCMGGTDMFALITGVQKSKYMCMACSAEYYHFREQQLLPDDSALSQQEQLAVIQKMLDEAETHMKQWVSERGSR